MHLSDLPRLIERMHRRYLDVVRIALDRSGAGDISPVQFMMLQTINASEQSDQDGGIAVRELVTRGYYLGSNASYNLKQLVAAGYIDRSAAARDRRAARLRLTPRGRALCQTVATYDHEVTATLATTLTSHDLAQTHQLLRALERCWSEAVHNARID